MNSFQNETSPVVERTVKTTGVQGYFLLWLFALLGVVIMALGVWRGFRSLRLATSGVHASGVVLASQQHSSLDSKGHPSTYFDTTIVFQAADGVSHQLHDHTAAERGQRFEVVYLAGNPDAACVFSFSNLWFEPLCALLIGSVFSTLMAGLAIRVKQKDKATEQLIASGIRATGTIIGFVQIGKSPCSVNGIRMWVYTVVVRTTNPLSHQELQINSDNSLFRTFPIENLVGKEVPVYFDPLDTSSYFIDLRGIE